MIMRLGRRWALQVDDCGVVLLRVERHRAKRRARRRSRLAQPTVMPPGGPPPAASSAGMLASSAQTQLRAQLAGAGWSFGGLDEAARRRDEEAVFARRARDGRMGPMQR